MKKAKVMRALAPVEALSPGHTVTLTMGELRFMFTRLQVPPMLTKVSTDDDQLAPSAGVAKLNTLSKTCKKLWNAHT